MMTPLPPINIRTLSISEICLTSLSDKHQEVLEDLEALAGLEDLETPMGDQTEQEEYLLLILSLSSP